MKFMWQYGTSCFSKLGKPQWKSTSEATHCWTCVSKYKCLFVMNIRITISEVLLRIPKTLTLMFCSLDDWQYTTIFFFWPAMLSSYAEPRQQPPFKSTGACMWFAGGTRFDELPLLFFSLTWEAIWQEIDIAR